MYSAPYLGGVTQGNERFHERVSIRGRAHVGLINDMFKLVMQNAYNKTYKQRLQAFNKGTAAPSRITRADGQASR